MRYIPCRFPTLTSHQHPPALAAPCRTFPPTPRSHTWMANKLHDRVAGVPPSFAYIYIHL
eukprot:1248783-Alexandrium_andersonii.AAC.1